MKLNDNSPTMSDKAYSRLERTFAKGKKTLYSAMDASFRRGCWCSFYTHKLPILWVLQSHFNINQSSYLGSSLDCIRPFILASGKKQLSLRKG